MQSVTSGLKIHVGYVEKYELNWLLSLDSSEMIVVCQSSINEIVHHNLAGAYQNFINSTTAKRCLERVHFMNFLIEDVGVKFLDATILSTSLHAKHCFVSFIVNFNVLGCKYVIGLSVANELVKSCTTSEASTFCI